GERRWGEKRTNECEVLFVRVSSTIPLPIGSALPARIRLDTIVQLARKEHHRFNPAVKLRKWFKSLSGSERNSNEELERKPLTESLTAQNNQAFRANK